MTYHTSKVLIGSKELLEIIRVLSITTDPKDQTFGGVYFYSAEMPNEPEEDDDDSIGGPGMMPVLAGVSSTGEAMGHYYVKIDTGDMDPFFWTTGDFPSIIEFVKKCEKRFDDTQSAKAENETPDDDDHEPKCLILVARIEYENGMDEFHLSQYETADERAARIEAEGEDVGNLYTFRGGSLTDFPADRISANIRGESLDVPMKWSDLDEDVPAGPVTIWPAETAKGHGILQKVARAVKCGKDGYAVQVHHPTRLHTAQCGSKWRGAIATKGTFSHSGDYDPMALLSETCLPDEVFEDGEPENEAQTGYDDGDEQDGDKNVLDSILD